MKFSYTNLRSLILFALAISSLQISCRSKKQLPKGEQEVVNPCPENKSKDYFSASANGVSVNQNMSYDLAYQACCERIALSMQQKLEIIRDNYSKQSTVNTGEEFKTQFQNLARTTASQCLIGVTVSCNKTVKTAEGKYKTYLSVELSSSELLKKYHETISKDEQLKLDYDYEKFKKEFEKEFDKLKSN